MEFIIGGQSGALVIVQMYPLWHDAEWSDEREQVQWFSYYFRSKIKSIKKLTARTGGASNMSEMCNRLAEACLYLSHKGSESGLILDSLTFDRCVLLYL